jgi:nicotinamidase-related amidase
MTKGSVGHKSSLALLLIDVINHFEFPDGTKLLRNAAPIAPAVARLKKKAGKAGVPVIYVNDNFGQWRSDAEKLVAYCLRPECASRTFVQAIRPAAEDYFVLKPMHSAFYQTPLDTLLRYLGASSIILAGLSTNSCILCTAHDAKMRDLDVMVPEDCCAARSAREHAQAVEHLKDMGDIRVLTSSSLRLRGARL